MTQKAADFVLVDTTLGGLGHHLGLDELRWKRMNTTCTLYVANNHVRTTTNSPATEPRDGDHIIWLNLVAVQPR